MSLRRRVLLGCLAVALVLLAADVALASTFRAFLLDQLDEQLTESASRLASFAGEPRGPDPGSAGGPGGPEGRGGRPLSEFYVAIADADGDLVGRLDTPLRDDRSAPQPTAGQIQTHTTDAGEPLEPFTADSDGDGRWRLVSVQAGGGGGEVVVIGASLDGVDTTSRRMVAVLVIATVTVFLTLAAVAWWVLRQGVRPLVAMTSTAEAIAGGALHERVENVDERTEAGRLGAALNTMLSRIEMAFSERAKSEERLRRFVADASHELRTPLTSIRGYAELYRTGALDDERKLAEAMRRVEQEARRMGALVEDLLLLASLDQGRPLEALPVDLDVLVSDAVADLRAVDPQRPVALDAAPVIVTGDDARLRQAVSNLVANVRAHTPPATPVAITALAADGHAVVEVADEGPGMPPEVAARVFERFYRADPSRARPAASSASDVPVQGSGLGLAIVAGIVRAHGGRASVDSVVGSGTIVRLVLPLAGAGSSDG